MLLSRSRRSSVSDPLSLTVDAAGSVIASTSDEHSEHVCFQYTWPLKVSKRLVENEDTVILNVSPPFATSYNGVAFTWTIRLSDECVIGIGAGSEMSPPNDHVLISLYYKDGPVSEVSIDAVKMSVVDPATECVIFDGLSLQDVEINKGSGWPVSMGSERQALFTELVHRLVDTPIHINVELKIRCNLFNPLNYLPLVDKACRSQRIERCCQKFVDDFNAGNISVPNLDLISADNKEERFSGHRMVFIHGCDSVERECGGEADSPEMLTHIRSTFAHVYFKKVLLNEVKCFEDFIWLMEGIISAHLPSLKREAERFICREVMTETVDPTLVKKMLLLSERYNLDVLKMVARSMLADNIVAHEDPPKEFVHIKHELRSLASQISTSIDEDPEEAEDTQDALVGSVVEGLQSLTRRIRRVSLSHSASMSSGSGNSTPVTPNGSQSLSPAATSANEARHFDVVADSPSGSRFKRVELDCG